MDTSIFADKSKQPAEDDLSMALGKTLPLWKTLSEYVLEKYPAAIEEWNFPGQKYGWSFRIKDKKRAIIYLLPRDGFFKVAMIFGDKGFNAVLESSVSQYFKDELSAAKKYAEGRGIRIDIINHYLIEDIKKLIDIKLSY